MYKSQSLRTVSTGRVVIATGTFPRRPADIPFDDRVIVDSDGILGLHTIPRSLTVIGGGVIGIEYATIFRALDVRVTLVDAHETLLPFVDQEIMAEFLHRLRDYGMELDLGARVRSIVHKGEQALAVLELSLIYI